MQVHNQFFVEELGIHIAIQPLEIVVFGLGGSSVSGHQHIAEIARIVTLNFTEQMLSKTAKP